MRALGATAAAGAARAAGALPLLCAAFAGLVGGGAADASPTWEPSARLSFRVSLGADSILLGDPIAIVLEGAGPAGAALRLPELADSVGPFDVLSADAVRRSERDDRTQLRQEGSVTLFDTGTHTLPSLPLLWISASGETLAAWSEPLEVRVGSLIEEDADLGKLRGVKGVVRLALPDWVWWAAGAAFAAAAGVLLWRLWRRRRPAQTREIPAPPPIPPIEAFEAAWRDLLERRLPEQGRTKEHYLELSFLVRRYLEQQFGFPAVEETRTEVLGRAASVAAIREPDRAELASWLEEGDLVKFAKLEVGVAEAGEHASRARTWVRALDERAVSLDARVEARAGSSSAPPSADRQEPAGARTAGEERP